METTDVRRKPKRQKAGNRHHRVSIAEARRTALAILTKAERRRAAFAEQEAAREAVWEEGA